MLTEKFLRIRIFFATCSLLPDDFRNQFHAVPHAVKALDQPFRSIMAMMKIAPEQTLVNGIPFQAMFENNVGLCTDSK